MSVQMILLPVFVLVGLAFALLFGMAGARAGTMKSNQGWSARANQFGDCFSNQFELPVLFYVLIALGLPLRKIDLVLVLLSWVFVVMRFAHAGIFVTSNNIRHRASAWLAGVIVLLAMWFYFALKILLSL